MARLPQDAGTHVTGYAAAPAVGWVDLEGTVYVAALPDPPILVLAGPAALIWQMALATPREQVADAVARIAGVPVDDIRSSVCAFVEEMLTRGLLIEA